MSFTNSEILTLAKAGFSAEQIAALNSINQEPEPATPVSEDAKPAVDKAPAQDAKPEPEKPPEEAPKQSASIDDVLTAINSLGKTFQSGFLQGAEQPRPVTAESILAEIINPPSKDS